MNELLSKLREPSTIRGLLLLLAALGVKLDPEQIEAITIAVLAGLGVVEVFRKEK